MSLIRNSPERMLRIMAGWIVFFLVLPACVPLDQLPPGSVPNLPSAASTAAAYPDPDAGSVSVTSTHFTLKGYNQAELENLKQIAESDYNKIGNDTGLYTFMSAGSYTLIEYKDHEDYMAKTHQPSWSHAVTAGKAIYFYADPDLEPVLAHEMVHLFFSSFMGDKARSQRWLDEGLAMNQEVARMRDSDRVAYLNSKISQLRQNRMPFSQMTFFVTNTEEKRRTDAWYQQDESVVTYLLTQGSPLAFAQMLSELKSGSDIDRALSDAYSGKFRNLSELESLWKYTI